MVILMMCLNAHLYLQINVPLICYCLLYAPTPERNPYLTSKTQDNTLLNKLEHSSTSYDIKHLF